MNYNNKIFKPISNSEKDKTTSKTIFHYKQIGNMVTAKYRGGKVLNGHLIGMVNRDGEINLQFHQINLNGDIVAGSCKSKPEVLANGKIRLHEDWQWTTGDKSTGNSIIDEI